MAETILTYIDAAGLNLLRANSYACLAVTGANPAAQSVTVLRGILDTVPVPHPAGVRLWFAQSRAT